MTLPRSRASARPGGAPRLFAPRPAGQSSVEYLVVTVLLALALLSGAPSPLEALFRALSDGYQKFSYSISRP